jgi:hypothetical protein
MRCASSRSAALVLPDLGLQLAAHRAGVVLADRACVLAVREGGVERVVAASLKARAAAVAAGETVARARSLVQGLVVLRPEAGEEAATLDALAEAMGTLSPGVERCRPGTLLLDASTAALVRFPGPSAGEPAESRWAKALLAPATALGLSGHVVVADTPAAARLFATHAALSGGTPMRLLPSGAQSALLGPLPLSLVEVLAREVRVHGASSPDDEALALSSSTFRWLESLRLSTLADLRRLPARTLVSRLGAEAERLLFWAHGGRERPMDVLRPSPVLEESVEFEPPLKETEGLLFALGPLLERLSLRATARGRAVTTLSAECALDLFESTGTGPLGRASETWEVRAAKPTSEARALRELVRGRLERWRARAPVVRVRLSVSGSAERREQLSLGEKPRLLEALGSALGRLSERLGPQAVGLLVERDHHLPERATGTAPFEPKAPGQRSAQGVEERAADEVIEADAGEAVEGGPDPWPGPPLKLWAPEKVAHEVDADGRPCRLRVRGAWHRVAALSPPTRLSTGWHEAPDIRDYRTALLFDGTQLWLFVDPDGRFWLQGVHD